jgi:DNA-directed RNA polymerase specialized sigma24 family protein
VRNDTRVAHPRWTTWRSVRVRSSRALAQLSPAEREVVALRVLLELDGPTTARVLGISVTACSTRLSRALKRLEEMMSDARD